MLRPIYRNEACTLQSDETMAGTFHDVGEYTWVNAREPLHFNALIARMGN